MERRVVITGMGIWSCIGTTLDEVRQSLFEGRSGIVFSQERKDAGFRSPICGNVPHPDLKKVLNRNVRQMMPEEAQYAYVATVQALEQAKLTQDYIDSHEVGVIYGNDSVAEATMIAMDKFRQAGSTAACGSGAIFQSMNSTVTMNLATLFHLKGINLTASAACASGSQSLGLGFLLIKNGPTKASRPFDRDRDGLVPSGGAATLVIESYDHAVRRGAPILAEILGWGFSGNGDHISTPNVEGPARSLLRSLESAGVSPSEIGYVNAHATSTPIGDSREAEAIAQVFGDYRVPVTSTKSLTGHEMWMAGASEIVYSMVMMKNDFIGGSLNFENPDEVTQRINVLPETVQQHFDMFLSNSFGFGGTNSTLIIKDIK